MKGFALFSVAAALSRDAPGASVAHTLVAEGGAAGTISADDVAKAEAMAKADTSPELTKVAPKEMKAEAPTVETPKAEAPKVEEVKAEAPKVEEVKAEAPKVEEAKAEAPKVEEAKAEAPKVEEVKAEAPTTPSAALVKAEAPKVEEVKAEAPKVEEVKAEAPKVEEVKAEAPKVEEAKVEAPKVEEVKAEAPTTPSAALVKDDASSTTTATTTAEVAIKIDDMMAEICRTHQDDPRCAGYDFDKTTAAPEAVEVKDESEIKTPKTAGEVNVEIVKLEEHDPKIEEVDCEEGKPCPPSAPAGIEEPCRPGQQGADGVPPCDGHPRAVPMEPTSAATACAAVLAFALWSA